MNLMVQESQGLLEISSAFNQTCFHLLCFSKTFHIFEDNNWTPLPPPCVCACLYTCNFNHTVCIHVEVTGQIHALASHLVRGGPLVAHLCICQALRPETSGDSPTSASHLTLEVLNLQTWPWLLLPEFVEPEDLNWGPHTCTLTT